MYRYYRVFKLLHVIEYTRQALNLRVKLLSSHTIPYSALLVYRRCMTEWRVWLCVYVYSKHSRIDSILLSDVQLILPC